MQKTPILAKIVVAACVLASGIAGARAQGTTNPNTAVKPQTSAQKTTGTKPHTATTTKSTAPALTTDKDKQSYALGMNIGRGLKQQAVDIDPALVAKGLRDTLEGGKVLLTDTEAEAALGQLQTQVRAKAEAEQKKLGDANMKEGQDFLAANKTKDGVVTLPDGLQYKILTQGTGPKPTADDTVVCNYRGTFLNGTEFDSSYKRNQPATFPLKGVIKGWTEALQLMPVGSKWQLYIPSDLAYGPGGRGPIPPNATLIFEVELISIQGKQ
ncbi:MAG TPA: FKBP-type peptidyl-prolyl cis-trans isomerase [Candidatus Aquilonibacter sp.]|nr:FKBP-type peptidyl-prolyl cis-trans isomerase [Candidatus Aquilonibacter sp.]